MDGVDDMLFFRTDECQSRWRASSPCCSPGPCLQQGELKGEQLAVGGMGGSFSKQMLLSVSLQLSAEDQLSPSEAVRKMLVVEYFRVEICGVNVSVYRKIRLSHNKGSCSHNY